MQRKQIIEIAGFIALFAIIVTTVLPRQIDKGIIEANQALEEIKQIQQQGASQYLQTKGISDITSKNTSSSLSFDTTNITLSATLLGAKTSIDSYLKPYYAKNPNSIKMGFNISVPLGVAGNNFVNRLQSISFEINSTYPLEAANTGFRYWTGQTKVDQFIVTNDYVVYDFSDILSHFTYKINTTDENNKPITADVPVDYQINIKGNSATISFNMTQIKFLAGQTINLDPSVSISNVATYSPSILNNVTTEAAPLSHITMNDSNITGYYPFDVNSTTIYDYSANNQDGTVSGSPQYNNSGYIGGGMFFKRATLDYIALPKATIKDNASFTISAWIYSNGSGDGAIYTESISGVNTNLIYLQWTGIGGGDIEYLIGNNSKNVVNSSSNAVNRDRVRNNTWAHVVFTQVSKAERHLYVNGTERANDTTSLTNTTLPTLGTIGARRSTTTTNYFNGTIDELMIWNRSLSASEVTLLYNSQYGRYATAPRTQDLNNVSIGQDGTIDSINITTNTTQLNGTSMQLQLWYYDSTGANTANSSWQSVTTGTNQVTNFSGVPVTTYNVSLFFNFSSNAFAGYSPILHDSINITSWSQAGATTTCTPPSTPTNDWLVTCPDNCNVTGVNTIVHSLNITGTSGYFNVIDGSNLTINGNLYSNGCPINVQLINGKSSKIYVNASYR